jgi:hypothetical protein
VPLPPPREAGNCNSSQASKRQIKLSLTFSSQAINVIEAHITFNGVYFRDKFINLFLSN